MHIYLRESLKGKIMNNKVMKLVLLGLIVVGSSNALSEDAKGFFNRVGENIKNNFFHTKNILFKKNIKLEKLKNVN